VPARSKPKLGTKPPEGFGRWIASLGLAATITSGFGLTSTMIETAREQHMRQCEMASELVADDRLSGTLTPEGRSGLVGLAARSVNRCLEEVL
jgi:hypothetical protein